MKNNLIKISKFQNANIAKMQKMQKSITERQLETRKATQEKTKNVILELKILITGGDKYYQGTLEKFLKEIKMTRNSIAVSQFLEYLKIFDNNILKKAIGTFMFTALESFDKTKGTKISFFLAILNNQNKPKNVQFQENPKEQKDGENTKTVEEMKENIRKHILSLD